MSDTLCTRCERNTVVPGSAICRECLNFRCSSCTRPYPHGHACDLTDFAVYDKFMRDHPNWPIVI